MARSKKHATERRDKARRNRLRTERRAAHRKVSKAINERFAAIIIRGQRLEATEAEQLARNVALIQFKNRKDKQIETNHTSREVRAAHIALTRMLVEAVNEPQPAAGDN